MTVHLLLKKTMDGFLKFGNRRIDSFLWEKPLMTGELSHILRQDTCGIDANKIRDQPFQRSTSIKPSLAAKRTKSMLL
jgi:hypothetical protein